MKRQPKLPARLALMCVILNCIVLMPSKARAESQTVVTQSNGVSFEISYSQTYSTAKHVVINYVVTNGSSKNIKVIAATPIYNLKVGLISPDGVRVKPYPYDNENFSRFFVATLKPGKRGEDKIDLAECFPFNVAGDYRCTITKRVYEEDPAIVPASPHDLQGKAIDLTAPEFHFRIESLDSDKSPIVNDWPGAHHGDELNGMRSNEREPAFQPQPTENGTKSSTLLQPNAPHSSQVKERSMGESAKALLATPNNERGWLVWLLAIVAATGAAWLVLKKRK